MPGVIWSPEKFKSVKDTDWARLAAFIDGEGCICIKAFKSKVGRRHQVVVQVTNTDPSLPYWLVSTFQAGHIQQRNRIGKWSTVYDWMVRGKQACYIIEKCMPFFVIKVDQAKVALKFNALGYYQKKNGQRLDPEIIGQRDVLQKELSVLKFRNKQKEAFHAG